MHCLTCLRDNKITYVSTGLPECILGHSVSGQDIVEETERYENLLVQKKDAELNPIREFIRRQKQAANSN